MTHEKFSPFLRAGAVAGALLIVLMLWLPIAAFAQGTTTATSTRGGTSTTTPGTGTTTPTGTLLITRDLQVGDQGTEVAVLQAYLSQFTNVYPEGLVTGYYGPLTQAGVQRYQCAMQVACAGSDATGEYGRIGTLTRVSLNNGGTPSFGVGGPATISKDLDPGESGADVTNLQLFLTDLPSFYPEGLVTGFYGPLTQAGVERYQCARQIVCDGTAPTTGYGRVGPTTRTTINNEIANFEAGTGTTTGNTTTGTVPTGTSVPPGSNQTIY